MVESTPGKRESRSTVSMKVPESSYGQSFYPMHPACIDGCFQTVSPALWQGDRTTVGSVLVPSVISSLIITGREQQPQEAISVASAKYLGIGRTDTPRNYGTSCSVYDPKDGALLLEMKGLKFAELDTSEDDGPGHTFTRLSWDADISMLLSGPSQKLKQFLDDNRHLSAAFKNAEITHQESVVQYLADLVAHKNPRLKVAEVNLDPSDISSLWLQGKGPTRLASSAYHFTSSDPTTLVTAQEKHSPGAPNASFSLLNVSEAEIILADVKFDLIYIKIPRFASETAVKTAIDSAAKSVQDHGLILAIGPNGSQGSSAVATALENIGTVHTLDESVYICQFTSQTVPEAVLPRSAVNHVSLLKRRPAKTPKVLEELQGSKWNIKTAQPNDIEHGQTVLIVDELSSSLMDRLDERQWLILQTLIQKECKILWVTSGAQLNVTEPTKAAINGFFRVLRAEDPLLHLVTLDVGHPSGPANVNAINACLEVISNPKPKEQADSEFVERNGILYISRVLPDRDLTDSQSDEISSSKTETIVLHASETPIRLRAERLGNIDSIHYGEVSPTHLPLRDGCIEVELYAAGMNYKDVVVTMGIVPGNEHTLGGEGAGIVTRVSPEIENFKVGERVVVFDKGCFANRIQTTPGRVHHIPDTMSFEEASTLSAVYLTSIYGLFDLANLRRGQRVLIHSAAGGVGIAAIQLCQYIGAEVCIFYFPVFVRNIINQFVKALCHGWNAREERLSHINIRLLGLPNLQFQKHRLCQ